MKESKLERIIIEADVICDYCDRVIPAGSLVFARFEYDAENNLYHYYWCSTRCLDEYEAEELIDDLAHGCHETSEDYFEDIDNKCPEDEI